MADIVLLDGSIGQELMKRSGDTPTPLWSTQVMLDHPEMVREVHDMYFVAGATVATTNTYAVLKDRLEGTDSEGRIAELSDAAVSAALAAREEHGSGKVAGALGPLFASYRPDVAPSIATAVELYAEPVELLQNRVDLILLETVASLRAAEGVLKATINAGVPVWLSITVAEDDGSRLRSGEDVGALAPLIAEYGPEAVLVNCSPPEVIGSTLDVLATFDRPFGAYANGFTHISTGFLGDKPTVDALEARQDLTPAAYAEFAMGWIDQGATIVGGCCEVGPEHISELARRLRAAGHRIV